MRDAATQFYDFAEYRREADAFGGMEEKRPSVVLIGEKVAPDGGFAFLRRLRQSALADLPVIFLAGPSGLPPPEATVGEAAILIVTEPFSRTGLIKAVAALINDDVRRGWRALPKIQRQVLDDTLAAFNHVATLIETGRPVDYGPVEAACRSVVDAVGNRQFCGLLRAVKAHDDYSFSHSLRVGTLLSLFGHTIGLSSGDQLLMASGGLLHDLGKIAIPPAVLNKPGRLTDREMAVMQGHVEVTAQILKRGTRIPKGVITIAANHHEKLDGSGYPNGLAAPQLDELARMSAIVDVFSAMTDRRPYKPEMTAEQAFRLIVDTMGRQLDMHLLALFREVLLDAVRSDPDDGARRGTA